MIYHLDFIDESLNEIIPIKQKLIMYFRFQIIFVKIFRKVNNGNYKLKNAG